MTPNELINQLAQMDHQPKMQVLDDLIAELKWATDSLDSADETIEDAACDKTFANSQAFLLKMAAHARQSRDRGLNQEPDIHQGLASKNGRPQRATPARTRFVGGDPCVVAHLMGFILL